MREPVWRQWARSWWVLLAAAAWLNWTAFVYAGLRAKYRRWLVWAGIYLALSAVSLLLIAFDRGPRGHVQTLGYVGAWLGIIGWAASLVHAVSVRRDFLERVEALEDPKLEAAEDRLRETDVARKLAHDDPEKARRLGVGRPDLANSFDGGLIDVNSAPESVLERLPGVSRALAKKIASVREEINGFSSVYDLGQALDIDANEVDRLRDVAVFLPRS